MNVSNINIFYLIDRNIKAMLNRLSNYITYELENMTKIVNTALLTRQNITLKAIS